MLKNIAIRIDRDLLQCKTMIFRTKQVQQVRCFKDNLLESF